MFKTTFITLALASTVAGGPALAGGPGHAWQVGNNGYHLYLADQDLQTTAGRAEALARVEGVAGRLCRNAGVRVERQACEAQIVQGVSGSLKPVIVQALAERARGPAPELQASR